MQRPLFSASHSAKLIQQQRVGLGHRADRQKDPGSTYWVQTGVTARGEVWRTHSDIRSDTLIDEHGCCEQHDADNHRAADGVEVGRDPERFNSHGTEHHADLGNGMAAIRDTALFSPSPSTTTTTMAAQTRWWISLWFLITIPVIFWDASYCFLRPRSMKGGDLHWIWSPYALYQEIDYVYGMRAFENGEGFTNAQSALNIVENFMNMGYLWLAHISQSPIAPVIGFTSAVMTLSKTVLYWLQEYYCGGCSVGHNDLTTLIVYWVIPNGLWLLVPSFISAKLGADIAASLRATDKAAKKKATGKSQ